MITNMKKKSYVTALDLFCGSGGSTTGAIEAGIEVTHAVNHWPKALETHAANHPTVEHDLTDISGCDPHRYPATDILIASPSCTHQSNANGKKKPSKQANLWDEADEDAAAERSRATMLDVVRFASVHDYRLILIENVVEAATRWKFYGDWLGEMEKLNYHYRELFLNSQFFEPTPQSRDRFYCVFWKKGNKAPRLDFYPKAYCPKCEKTVEAVQSWKKALSRRGKYGKSGQYWYRCPVCAEITRPFYSPASTAIDFTIPSERIGERKRPLEDKTIERVRYGLAKFKTPTFIMGRGGNTHDHEYPLWQPLPTQTSTPQFALLCDDKARSADPAFVVDRAYQQSNSDRTTLMDEVMPTQTSRGSLGLFTTTTTNTTAAASISSEVSVVSNGQIQIERGTAAGPLPHRTPFIVELRNHCTARPIEEALSTLTTGRNHVLITPEQPQPFLTSYYGSTKSGHSLNKPLGTITSVDRHALVTPPTLEQRPMPFVMSYYSREDATRSVGEPLATVTAEPRHSLVNPGGAGEATLRVEDCYFRMLKVKEIKRAMAFPDSYLLLGTERDQIRMLGQAVTPPVMKWIIERCLATLAS